MQACAFASGLSGFGVLGGMSLHTGTTEEDDIGSYRGTILGQQVSDRKRDGVECRGCWLDFRSDIAIDSPGKMDWTCNASEGNR